MILPRGGNERNASLLVRDYQRMTLYGNALGVGWGMVSLGEVRRPNPLGAAAPRDLALVLP